MTNNLHFLIDWKYYFYFIYFFLKSYPHSTIPALNVLRTFPWNVRKIPSERSRNLPRTKKMSEFFERSKAMFSKFSCGTFQERLKGVLRERSAAIFREYSERTFLEPSMESFREHLYRTIVELFVGTFFENVPGIIFYGIQVTFFIGNQMLPLWKNVIYLNILLKTCSSKRYSIFRFVLKVF